MKDSTWFIYNRLPHFLKQFAAETYARKLHSFRWNASSAGRVREAGGREEWTFSQWNSYQEEELEKVLQRAVSKVPYYRNYWQQQGMNDNKWKDLRNWPVLTKQEVRENNALFLAEDCVPSKMYREYTSGTSGTPLQVSWSKETTLSYYAVFERRIRNWHKVELRMNYLMLGGRLIIPVNQTAPPFWVHNRPMNQLYLSSYHLSERNIRSIAQAIEKFKPEYMYGYASSMYSLAYLLSDAGIEVRPLKCAINNAEQLYDHQGELIKRVFGSQIVNTYGMSELVAAGCTYMDQKDLILWPEVGMMEIYDYEKDINVGLEEEGRIICTSLLNKDMPFIKYDMGDCGALGRSRGGIDHYVVKELSGRKDDLIVTSDGRRIGRLDPVFKENFNIREAQIIQNRIDDFVIKVVPDINYCEENGRSIADSLKERVGDVSIRIQPVESIPRTNTGKFKAVISLLGK